MISNWIHVLKEANRRRIDRRRARRGGYAPSVAHHVPSVLQVADGSLVDVVAEYGARDAVDPRSIRLATTSQAPEVSIVIAAYGKVNYTLRCLQSIARNPPSVPFEVLVVEDASGEVDARACGEVAGVRFVLNEQNLGYLRSCNRAVGLTTGAYVYLLNNDTQVLPGAIDALLARCRHGAKVMAGSRLVYPDGTLQDAGGVVWQNGRAWIYGRGDHPSRHAYNYPREVDYCTGASLMLPRSLWDEVGGYDERYAPAYYEDTDLAFKVREAGGRVFYEPRSVVIHDEGVSHGRSENEGLKAYQKLNAQKLAERWAVQIQADSYPHAECLLKAKDRARHRKTILVIDHYIPEADRDAGSRSILSFIEALLDLGHVVKFWPDNFRATPGYTEALQARGVEVFAAPESFSYVNWLQTNGACLDGVLLSRPTVAKSYIDVIRRLTKIPVVFYGHDLHFARMAMQADVTGNSRLREEAEEMKALETRIWSSVDVSFYPAQEEVDAVKALSPSVDVRRANAYCLTVGPPRSARERSNDLLFVAGFRHPPNEDAAAWLVEAVMPHVRRALPDVRLVLAGSSPTERVKALACDAVTVTGSLSAEALAEQYQRAQVAVVPLRFGAGVKLKVLEAMVERVPLVTTSVGVQGLPDAGFLPVADDAEGFAAHVVSLLRDAAARDRLVTDQARFIEQTYSLAALKATLSQVF